MVCWKSAGFRSTACGFRVLPDNSGAELYWLERIDEKIAEQCFSQSKALFCFSSQQACVEYWESVWILSETSFVKSVSGRPEAALATPASNTVMIKLNLSSVFTFNIRLSICVINFECL